MSNPDSHGSLDATEYVPVNQYFPWLLGYSGVSFVYLRDQDSTRLLGTSQDNLN
jgi:hypothetical protein